MQLIFQFFLSCCLLATVAHRVELKVNPELKKSTWLGSRLTRDLDSVSVEKTAESENFVRPEDSSTDINVRAKRSENSTIQSRRQGCTLGTCTVHDLVQLLHQLKNKNIICVRPAEKIKNSST